MIVFSYCFASRADFFHGLQCFLKQRVQFHAHHFCAAGNYFSGTTGRELFILELLGKGFNRHVGDSVRSHTCGSADQTG